MKRLKKLAKRKIYESCKLIFDQTGLDVSQVANDPVKTFTGKSIITDIQLRAICKNSKPMSLNSLTEGSGEPITTEERFALANRQMASLPDSLLNSEADKTLLN